MYLEYIAFKTIKSFRPMGSTNSIIHCKGLSCLRVLLEPHNLWRRRVKSGNLSVHPQGPKRPIQKSGNLRLKYSPFRRPTCGRHATKNCGCRIYLCSGRGVGYEVRYSKGKVQPRKIYEDPEMEYR